ncbi:MAG: hypothetical protein JW862_04405, partial [Anaerolineales bacterium]|nr:hypothetical protein [Anaerolineales bacterium]
MSEKDFDKLLQDWGTDEKRAAPALRPTEGMYRLVEAQVSKTRPGWWRNPQLVMAAALSALVLL